jgi:hypothetical protein
MNEHRFIFPPQPFLLEADRRNGKSLPPWWGKVRIGGRGGEILHDQDRKIPPPSAHWGRDGMRVQESKWQREK